MDSTQRFTSRVSDYVKARPTYPASVVDALEREIGFDETWKVADIGSGTGISTKLFLDAGNEVWGIEPNDAMREASIELLQSFDRFHPISARSESTTLPSHSIDLVVAAQAFHWFDRAEFKRECKRILTSRGHLLLMWNDRRTSGSPFLESYERLLNDFGTDYKQVNHQQLADETIAEFFAPAGMKVISLPNEQRLDEAGLIARLMSSSYVPQSGDPEHRPMLDRARQLFHETNVSGMVTMVYELKLYLGKIGSD